MATDSSFQIPLIVLTGGRSSRMGTDKALVTLNGEPMLSRICRVLQPVASSVVVVAAADQELPALPDETAVQRDRIPHAGPLHGLIVGLEYLNQTLAPEQKVLVTSTDLPLVTTGVAKEIILRGVRSAAPVWITIKNNIRQPFPGVYQVSLLNELRNAFDEGERSIRTATKRAQTVDVSALSLSGNESEFLSNVNSPDDLKLIRRMIGARDEHP